MGTHDGSIQFVITPETGQGDILFQKLKKEYRSCHLYFDGFFIYLKTNTDCSCGFINKLEKSTLAKTIKLNQEITLKPEDKKMERENINIEDFERGNSIQIDTSTMIKAKIKVKPRKGINRTVLFEDLNHAFPDTIILMSDDYFTIIKKTNQVSEIITKAQAVDGVEYALYS